MLKEQVRFALTRQEGEERAAIDGDGHAVVTVECLRNKVVPEWEGVLEDLNGELWYYHGIGTEHGPNAQDKGVSMLALHHRVARMVQEADPTFRHDGHGYIGRGSCAQAMHKALAAWCGAQKC